jgi:hypothetical protein
LTHICSDIKNDDIWKHRNNFHYRTLRGHIEISDINEEIFTLPSKRFSSQKEIEPLPQEILQFI